MDVQQLIGQVRDAMTVKRVFGESYDSDGVTVIPVAKVMGGGGGGGGQNPKDDAQGEGGGFGIRVRPVGVYVIRGSDVTWRPAVDVTRLALGGQLVALVTVLSVRSIVKARARSRR
ncbi:MAG TPA: spore germination protein GerW family protein [Jatrophihabitans sp.]|jgi:uncharacterized spore protein YtfJ|nr:spore germination protein GerW family protein [Jatrophihabitans sp.]